MKMYRVCIGRIEELEVKRKTEKSVWYVLPVYKYSNSPESRELLHTETHSWFDTREEAKAFLVEQAEQKVRKARDSLKYWLERLQEAKEYK